jgi:homoserine kinase type II
LAIALNDWCSLHDGVINNALAEAMCDGYQSVRPLLDAERQAWPLMLRAAALRFWVSRLWDWHRPQSGELTYRKDPTVFQRILAQHCAAGDVPRWV